MSQSDFFPPCVKCQQISCQASKKMKLARGEGVRKNKTIHHHHMGMEIEGGARSLCIVNRLRVVTFPPCFVPALIETRWHRSGDRAQRQETPAPVLLSTDSFSPRLASPRQPSLRLSSSSSSLQKKDSLSPLLSSLLFWCYLRNRVLSLMK